MAEKQYLICEPGKAGQNDEWYVLGTKDEIEEVLLDIIKDTVDPITDIKIFEITPVDFHFKMIIKPKASK